MCIYQHQNSDVTAASENSSDHWTDLKTGSDVMIYVYVFVCVSEMNVTVVDDSICLAH